MNLGAFGRAIAVALTAVALVAMVAGDADAQRRRRRRRAPVQETEQTEDATDADAGTPAVGNAAPGTTGTAPRQPGAGQGGAGQGGAGQGGAGQGGAGQGGAGQGGAGPGQAIPGTTPPGAAVQVAGEGAPPDGASLEATPPVDDAGPAGPDVTPIRTDYVALMDDLVQARMRVSALGAELFRTRITIDLQDRTGEHTSLARVVVHLDGAPVFQSDGAVEGAAEGREIFAGALAPGPHVLTLEAEQRAREDEAYRYTLRESYRFQVARERLSEVTLVLDDDSDMARSFPSGGEGRYEVRTRMRVATRALPSP